MNQAKHKNLASETRDFIEKSCQGGECVCVPVGTYYFFRAQYKAMPNDFNTALVKTVGGVIGMITGRTCPFLLLYLLY